jgi:hypothetical protein
MLPDENQGRLVVGGIDLGRELRYRDRDSRCLEPQARGEVYHSPMTSARTQDRIDPIGDEVLVRISQKAFRRVEVREVEIVLRSRPRTGRARCCRRRRGGSRRDLDLDRAAPGDEPGRHDLDVLVGQGPGETDSRAVELLLRAQLHLELQKRHSLTPDPHLLGPRRPGRETETRADVGENRLEGRPFGIPEMRHSTGDPCRRGAKSFVVGAADVDAAGLDRHPAFARRQRSSLAAKLDDRARGVVVERKVHRHGLEPEARGHV